MKQALARFERHVDRRFSHSSTSIHYLSDIRIFIHAHGSVAPRTVTAADIDAFIDAQLARGCVPLRSIAGWPAFTTSSSSWPTRSRSLVDPIR